MQCCGAAGTDSRVRQNTAKSPAPSEHTLSSWIACVRVFFRMHLTQTWSLERNNTRTMICHNKMTILCQTAQNVGKQMQEGFAAERTGRQEDFETESQEMQGDFYKMEQTMTGQDGRRLEWRTNGQTTGSR